MDSSNDLKIASGAGVAAVVLALASGRAPRGFRVALVLAALMLATTATYFVYRQVNQPRTLTIAIGSRDSDVPKIMSAISSRLASTNAPVRLKIVDKGSVTDAGKAFSAGETDLAIVRGDLGNLSNARTLLVVAHGVVLLLVPPGNAIESFADLKGKTVGVVGGEVNHPIVSILTKEYDLTRSKVQFRDLTVEMILPAVHGKQVSALLVVMPISEKYLGLVRTLFPGNAKQKLGLIPIESAGAIAAISRSYESYDLPKGTIRGSPALPDDDLTTLRVPFYLVASTKLDDDTAGAIAKAFMEVRRDLVAEFPLLANITTPSTEKDALIPVHPGAAAYFDGEQKSFFDKYGDQIFYGSLLLGSLTSILAGVWSYMMKRPAEPGQRPLNRLYALRERIGGAQDEAELLDIERSIDDILKSELERFASGESEAAETSALGLATHRLEYLIGQRRASLGRSAVPS